VHQVHGIDVRGVPVEAAGRTDSSIVRSLLEATGVGSEAIDRGAHDVLAAACASYEPPDLAAKVAPGIAELLPRLAAREEVFRFSLVTGNYERVARVKLAAAGIGHWFPEGQGGFGSDAEAREALPAIARGRAGGTDGPWPRERTVVIGDTPRDIACARADGVRVVAVTTGPYRAEDLTDADAVVAGASELEETLASFA
jgi:phosphoglycolate phosphatase-like HAD superfamily hydrolase